MVCRGKQKGDFSGFAPSRDSDKSERRLGTEQDVSPFAPDAACPERKDMGKRRKVQDQR